MMMTMMMMSHGIERETVQRRLCRWDMCDDES